MTVPTRTPQQFSYLSSTRKQNYFNCSNICYLATQLSQHLSNRTQITDVPSLQKSLTVVSIHRCLF
jgi:hypothetical protein